MGIIFLFYCCLYPYFENCKDITDTINIQKKTYSGYKSISPQEKNCLIGIFGILGTAGCCYLLAYFLLTTPLSM